MRITIKNDVASAVVETAGAELKSFRNAAGREYMWQADKKYWQKTAPVLFPNIGMVRNGKTIINGKEYEMPMHGFANRTVFDVVEQSEDRVVLSMSATEETKACYPFDFEFRVIFSLEGETITMNYVVTNQSNQAMPFCIGGHPGFNVPVGEAEDTFDNYYLEFSEVETTSTPDFNKEPRYWQSKSRTLRLNGEKRLMLNHKMFDNDAVFFDELKSRSVTMASVKTGYGVRMDFEDFETIAFWTPYKIESPFLCLEPWNGCDVWDDEDDEFAHKRHIQSAEPGETKSYQIKVTMLG